MASLFNEYGYMPLADGYIHKNDIPVIRNEPVIDKVSKSIIFFSIIIALILIAIYLIYSVQNRYYTIYSNTLIEKTHRLPGVVKAFSIDIIAKKDIDNIILITPKESLNIDIKNNKFVQKYKIDDNIIISLNFGSPLTIKQIVLISNPFDYLDKVQIKLYNAKKNQIWQYYDKIPHQRENIINISKIAWKEEPLDGEHLPDYQHVRNIDREEDYLQQKLLSFD